MVTAKTVRENACFPCVPLACVPEHRSATAYFRGYLATRHERRKSDGIRVELAYDNRGAKYP